MRKTWEIEVGYRDGVRDALGEAVNADIAEDLLLRGIESVSYVEIYRINARLTAAEIEKVCENLLHDRIVQYYSINEPLHEKFDWEITVTFNSDVTDNVGVTAEEGISDIIGRKLSADETVRTARKYVITGKLREEDVKKICTDLLANPIIETYTYRKGAK